MPRFANRGFTATLLIAIIIAELAVRAAADGPPKIVRVVYGTTLAMYMEIEARLRKAAPGIRVLTLGDSLPLTQFQPDVFAADHGLQPSEVFNASYLGMTFRSQENLLRDIGLDRFVALQRVLIFVNPRRFTAADNIDSAVFRVAIPDRDGALRLAWRERTVSPIFDRSRLYGLSRYLLSASWRQIGRPASWDEVEYLGPRGGIVFEKSRPAGEYPVYLFERIDYVDERYVADLKRVIDLFRARNVDVVLLPSVHHPSVDWFAGPAAALRFSERMRALATQTGSTWVELPAGFEAPADSDFLDYGHLNRAGGAAFTHSLRERPVD